MFIEPFFISRGGEGSWMSLVPSEKRLRSHALSPAFSFLCVFLGHIGSVGSGECNKSTARLKAMSKRQKKTTSAPTVLMCDVLHVPPLPPWLCLPPCKALSKVSQCPGVGAEGSQASLLSKETRAEMDLRSLRLQNICSCLARCISK